MLECEAGAVHLASLFSWVHFSDAYCWTLVLCLLSWLRVA